MDEAKKEAGWTKVTIAGHDFWRIPRKEINEMNRVMFKGKHYDDDDGPDFLVPYTSPKDEKLTFPGNAAFEDGGFVVRSGISSHSVDRMGVTASISNFGEGLTATQLALFDELDWYGECFGVLQAHGWIGGDGDVSQLLLDRIKASGGQDLINAARRDYGENWSSRVHEIGAMLIEPFSRLWYVANMMAIYYCHPIKFGYLWAEYRLKMRYELSALRHMEITEKNRESGMMGGQADKKRDRYSKLDQLAQARFKDIAFASDKQCLRLARQMASDYDAKADEPLFRQNGKPLSSKWYDDWLSHFRSLARGS